MYWSWENQHPDYSVDDWKYEVSNEDTLLGYHEWVSHKVESE